MHFRVVLNLCARMSTSKFHRSRTDEGFILFQIRQSFKINVSYLMGFRCKQVYNVNGVGGILSALWVTLYLVEANDVWVLQHLHNLHLSEYLFQVLIIQLGLIHNFYSHLETWRQGQVYIYIYIYKLTQSGEE